MCRTSAIGFVFCAVLLILVLIVMLRGKRVFSRECAYACVPCVSAKQSNCMQWWESRIQLTVSKTFLHNIHF